MTKAEMLASPESPWSKAEPSERIIVIRESDPMGRLVAEILASRVDECSLGGDMVDCKEQIRQFIDGQN